MLDGQPLASASAPSLNDLPAARRAHTCAEAVRSLSGEAFRLVGALGHAISNLEFRLRQYKNAQVLGQLEQCWGDVQHFALEVLR